mmetsp:Transcript_14703/g.42062  ORF Transcript_14703/g.42062 Transcript_14703/m.42062 type:complete len:393 (-) Transcript_14703:74-1252(-)
MSNYQGTIKSFNAQKGWGFIECADTFGLYGKDIFVMKSALPGHMANKGDQVSFSVGQGNGGPEATDVQMLQRGALGDPRLHGGGDVGGVGAKLIGQVKSFIPAKGWGFVTSAALTRLYGKDIFFLKNALSGAMVSSGEPVSFTIVQGTKGPEAVDIQRLSPTPTAAMIPAARPQQHFGHAGTFMPGMPARSPMAAMQQMQMLGGNSNHLFYGAIKNFNEEKGWGHIECTASHAIYQKDVFLMRTSLNSQLAEKGALVSFRIGQSPKGPQATDVTVFPPGSFNVDGRQGSFYSATVKSFNEGKGWGFVTSDEIQNIFGKDIFLHRLDLGGHTPTPGDVVQFCVEPGRTGQLQAKSVSFDPNASGFAAAGAQIEYEPARKMPGMMALGGRASPY